jgi:hypothetical protein
MVSEHHDERQSQDTEQDDRDFLHERLVLTEIDGEPVELDLWDTGRRDERGQTVIAYELRHADTTIFQGEDFAGSPLHADDSDATVGSLVGFLALRSGDTDADYFERYNATQIEWVDRNGEELGLIAHELSEAKIHCLDDLLHSEEYANSRFGSSSDDWISDPERAARRNEATQHGADGSTHGEHISDMRVCLREQLSELPEILRNRIEAEITELEEWHARRGSLDEET